VIAAAIGVAPAAIVFFTDAPAEVDAATAAGWRAVRVDRDGGPTAPDVIDGFAEISLGTGTTQIATKQAGTTHE
jgi:methionine salvage enolase-phosphatase E1